MNDGDTTGDGFTSAVGDDSNAGDQSDSPYRTINKALSSSQPGDTIAIDSGTFAEDLTVDTNDLLIRGAGTDTAVIEGNITKNGGSRLIIRNLTILNSGSQGISLSNSDTPIISNVDVVSPSDEGIFLSQVSGAKIDDSLSTGAGNQGIEFDATTGSTVTQSVIGNNGQTGILLATGSDNNHFSGNTVERNGQSVNSNGIKINSSSNNQFVDNISRGNSTHGFEDNASNNRYESNVARNNGRSGWNFSGATNPFLIYNSSTNNARNGIEFNSSTSDISLLLNEIKKNTEYQIVLGNGSSFRKQTKNNIVPSATNSDSLVLNQSGSTRDMFRNWWDTTDSGTIRSSTIGDDIKFIPFRLAPVDTQPNADTVAPESPKQFKADTSIPGQVNMTWNDPANNEEPLGNGIQVNGMRLYRSTNPDTTDWSQNLVADLGPSDTDYIDPTVQTDSTYFYRITAYDSGAKFENESYFSRVFKVNVPSTGPAIYVNDNSQVNDVFTANTGNDSNVGIAQHPVRTIGQALRLAEDGDTIFVDAGTYAETVTVDTPNITMIGAGQNLTFLDGTSTGDTGITVTGDDFHLRSVTLRNYSSDGIHIDGAGNSRLTNLSLRNNGDNGIQFSNGASNGYVAQATFDSNARHQIRYTGGATGNQISYSNIFNSPGNPDSGVTNTTGNPNPVTRNWWTATDSSVISGYVSGSSAYIPHRLGIVDTGVGADSIAPAPPNPSVDTSKPRQLSLQWASVTSDENGGVKTGHEGYRIFKIPGDGDTTDWTDHDVATLGPSDTRWVDTNVKKTKPYSYRMTSFDTATPENESYFFSVKSGTWFNRAPAPDTAILTTQVDSAVTVTVSGTDVDGDTLTFRTDLSPNNGTLSGTLPTVTYQPDTGFTGIDTFTFRITDGQDTSLPGTVTIDVATNLKINVSKVRSTASETPAIANGTDTIGIQFVFENTGTGNGIVRRDTDQLRIKNGLGREISDSFGVAMAGTDVVVPAGDTNTARWIIHPPNDPTGPADTRTQLLGNFQTGLIPGNVTLEDAVSANLQQLEDTPPNKRLVQVQINSKPDTFDSAVAADNLDEINVFNQSIQFNGGQLNGQSLFDFSSVSVSDGDSVFVVLQRGNVAPPRGINTLDTPSLDPVLGINTETEFENTVQQADQNLKSSSVSGSLNFVDTGLFSISLWLRRVNGTYIGHPEELNEDVEITIKNVQLPPNVNQPDRLEVVKLTNSGGSPSWETVDPLDNINGNFDGDITFTVSSDETETLAGFSVFRIIASGFSTSGTADETVAYPNPFVPTDGNPNTGSYGSGDRDGIHFGAGPDRGFPPNTTVKIYTVKGQLIDKQTTNAGGIIQWDAHTENGEPAASGVYIYRIEVPNRGDKVGKFAIVR